MIIIGVNGEGIDENKLLTGRSSIIAQSGAGKSYGVAVICEQLAANNLGFCIIDNEGEYSSLKQGFNILWVGGSKADLPVNNVDFSALAFKVISEGVPVILDVSDVKEPLLIVDKWLNALWIAANKIRKPYLLIIEEADRFIPQRGDKLLIINEIARRGRKRGLGLMVASQRPAIIDKEVLSQCNYQFIGRLTLDNDLNAVKSAFNSRNNLKKLPDLFPGEFFMIGFKPLESLFKFKKRVTKHKSNTPLINKHLPHNIKSIISELRDVNNAVKPVISDEEIKVIAKKIASRKYFFFGEKENVSRVKLIYKPLIEVNILTPKHSFFSEELIKGYIYLSDDLFAVDSFFNKLFNLSFLKNLNHSESLILLNILYSKNNTVTKLMKITGLSEREVRVNIKSLITKGLIFKNGWDGSELRLKPVSGIEMPRIKSIISEKINTSIIVNESFNFDESMIKKIIKSLNSKVKINNLKTIFYPFYEVELTRIDSERIILINAVTGRKM